ncbi:nucleotide exchange factor Sil1 [Toxorhynchites rutilus septentrionalis]|uniref:nucleotide exchange factor Sil1 n=1 Tax=Toxorhynchites rutilus septentrionalis TaxID=329112 RepID=UPI00247A38D8|nr:nucleotide exchange factor Sil1 [Toxorhynchites rutilus septentrionalis]
MKLTIILLVGLSVAAHDGARNDSNFVATDEWQEIGTGQAIPQGLHVRINLKTVKKEAKLLAKGINDTQSSASLSTIPGSDVQDHDPLPLPFGAKQLKAALQNIPGDDFMSNHEEELEKKPKFKSYYQIKLELKEANLEVMSDSDTMGSIFELFDSKRNQHPSGLKSLFEDLKYLVHQIDNANEFIDRQGIEKIIWPSLNGTDSPVRVLAFELLGIVVQNNPKAKVALFERSGGTILLGKISQLSRSEEISAALFAFGALIRKFPYAQTKLLNAHGYSMLFDVLNKQVELRVKVKVIILIADLVDDYEYALSDENEDATTKERYGSTNLTEGLRKTEYCKVAGEFIRQNRIGFETDINLAEEVVRALRRMVRAGLCQDSWSSCALFRHTLLVLRNNLDTRLDDEDMSDYYKDVQQMVDEFVAELYRSLGKKDEL